MFPKVPRAITASFPRRDPNELKSLKKASLTTSINLPRGGLIREENLQPYLGVRPREARYLAAGEFLYKKPVNTCRAFTKASHNFAELTKASHYFEDLCTLEWILREKCDLW